MNDLSVKSRAVTVMDALSDSLRLRIVRELERGAASVKELGAALTTEPNRLYYHLKVLEDAGLIAVDGYRAAGRGAERLYTSRMSDFAREELDEAETVAVMSSMLLRGADDLHQLLEQHKDADDEIDVRVAYAKVSVDRADWQAFSEEILALVARFQSDEGDKQYTVLFTTYEDPA